MVPPRTGSLIGLYALPTSTVQWVLLAVLALSAWNLKAQDLNLILALDNSGSMEDNDEGNLRFHVSRRLVEALRGSDTRVGVLVWGGQVDSDSSLPLTSDLSAVARHLDNPPDLLGGTDLNAAIDGIIQEFANNDSRAAKNVAILLSDGEGTYSQETAGRASDRGYVIHTIGLAVEAGDNAEMILRDIAARTGGHYFFAPDEHFLEEILRLLRNELLERESIKSLLTDVPTAIRLELSVLSATVGSLIDFSVYLVNAANLPTPAKRVYEITLSTDNGNIEPPTLIIAAGASSQLGAVRPDKPGFIIIKASEPGLRAAETTAHACQVGQIENLDLIADRSQVPVGTPINLTLRLTDVEGRPTTDNPNENGSRAPVLHHTGVGVLENQRPHPIPAGQCASSVALYSYQPGEAILKAALGSSIEARQKHFLFLVPLSLTLFLIVMGGGVAGAFVRASLSWSKSREWQAGSWAVKLGSGALTGVTVFLFVHYFGLEQLTPKWAGGLTLGLLLGIVGGYMGPYTIDRIGGRILPGAQEQREAPELPTQNPERVASEQQTPRKRDDGAHGADRLRLKWTEFVETRALRQQLAEDETQRFQLLKELGSAVHEACKRSTSKDEPQSIRQKRNSVSRIEQRIDEKMQEIRQIQRCAEEAARKRADASAQECDCGAPLTEGAQFCSDCGARIDVFQGQTQSRSETVKFCSQCGAVARPGARFCPHCGFPIPRRRAAARSAGG